MVATSLRTFGASPWPSFAVGEELGRSGTSSRLWTLDPIESTAAFVQGLTSQWSTLLALVEEGLPVVGVVARPAIGHRWWAAEGEGAFVDGRRLHVSARSDLSAAVLRSLESPSPI